MKYKPNKNTVMAPKMKKIAKIKGSRVIKPNKSAIKGGKQ